MQERKQKNVKFGLSKDDNFEVENATYLCDNVPSFSSARDYWQHMCNCPEPERRTDYQLVCKGNPFKSLSPSNVVALEKR